MAQPEAHLLWQVFRDHPLVTRLARAPGGWRTLSDHELEALGLTSNEKVAVLALQDLVSRGYPELPPLKFATSADVGRVYGARLGGLVREVMLAIVLDGNNHFLAEIEVALGGAHGLALTPPDVLRPLLRAGASAFVLVHNHPGGDPNPSVEDLLFTQAIVACADVVRMPLVDHVVVAGRGGGYVSLLDLGVIDPKKEFDHEE